MLLEWESEAEFHDVKVEGWNDGIVLGRRSRATIESCSFSNNALAISVEDSADADIKNNQIIGGSFGIHVYTATADISHNRLSHCGYCIAVGNCAIASINDNQISYGAIGIFVSIHATAHVRRNWIAHNGEAGISLADSAIDTHGNQIIDNGVGIELVGKGVFAVIGPNDKILGNQSDGIIVIVTSGELRIIDSTIQGNKGCGIRVEVDTESAPAIEGDDNVISNNAEGDLCPPDYPWPERFVRESG